MTQHATRPPYPPYVGQSPQPLRRRRWWQLLARDVKPYEIILFVLAMLGAFGFVNPIRRLAIVEARVDKLENKFEFTNYLQCVQLRRSDPTLLPPGCMPIIENQERGR